MPDQFKNLKFLVVDDNKPLRDKIQALLIRLGAGEVLAAADGAEGFRMLCEHKPNIVICDWVMDPVDGLELTHHIRHSNDSPDKMTPVILMTARTSKEDFEQARDSGVTEFLPKPCRTEDLAACITKVLEAPRPFVTSSDFFGPDRRQRAQSYAPNGEERRNLPRQPQSLYFQERRSRPASGSASAAPTQGHSMNSVGNVLPEGDKKLPDFDE